MREERDTRGRFAKGMTNNPGGLSKRQSSVLKALDGLTPRAVEVLGELLESEDESIRLKSAAEIIKRVAPKAAPASQTNVSVAVGIAGSGIQETLAVAKLRELVRQGRLAEAELVAALGRPVPLTAISAPVDAVDAEVTEVAPADSENEDCPV